MKERARRVLVLLAAIAAVLTTARLGVWQLSRAGQKEALQAALDERAAAPPLGAAELAADAASLQAQLFRGVRVRGHWLAGRTVFLDNRQMRGRPGFYVVTPLQLDDRPVALLVQRGWAPRDMADRTRVPTLRVVTDGVEILGRIAPPPARLYQFAADTGGAIRQNLDLDAFARESGLTLLPLSVMQADSPSGAGDGLLRDWPPPAADVHKHYGYAFQWFALAALITGLYVWFQLVRPRLVR